MVVRKKLVKKTYNDKKAEDFINRGGTHASPHKEVDVMKKTTLRMPQSLIDMIDSERMLIKPKAPSANTWILNLIYKKLKRN